MDSPSVKYKVLVNANACNPYRGSEHGVGWGWVRAVAESHEVHVVAASFEKEDIEHWLGQHPEYKSRMHFYFPRHRSWHYHKESSFWVKIENSPLKILMNMSYRLWQADAFRLARRLNEKQHFDLCHLITYVGFRFPGKFFLLDIPFVWGPIGGLENTPWHFMPVLGKYGAAYYTARNLINDFDRRFLPGPRRAMQKAAQCGGIIAATSGIKREIRRWYGADSKVICEIGPPPVARTETIVERKSDEAMRICWSGEHLPGKALQLLLQALAMLAEEIEWHLDVLGDGPCTQKWQDEADALGILPGCTFHGRLPRHDALGIVQQAHLFVITSLKDLTSTVLMEALSLGKPVIAPDHCGFMDVITDECGIKIPIQNIDTFIHQLIVSIKQLYENEPQRQQMSRGALQRIKKFSWDEKSKVLNRIYQKAVQNYRSRAYRQNCQGYGHA